MSLTVRWFRFLIAATLILNTQLCWGGDYFVYDVKEGDTISSVLYDLGATPLWGKRGIVKKIADINTLIKIDFILPGQSLTIPIELINPARTVAQNTEEVAPAPVIAPAPVAAPSVPAVPTDNFNRGSIFKFSYSNYFSQLKGTDPDTGSHAELLSDVNSRTSLEWEQLWTAHVSSYALWHREQEKFSTGDSSSVVLANPLSTSGIDIGLKYNFGERHRIFGEIGTDQLLYYRGISSPSGIQLLAVQSQKLAMGYERKMVDLNPLQLWTGAKGSYFLKTQGSDFTIDSATEYEFNSAFSQKTKFGFINLTGYYRQMVLKSNVLDIDRQEVGLSIGAQYFLGAQ